MSKRAAKPSVKPNRKRLREGAGSVAHINTRQAFVNAWRKLASELYSARVCKGMPPFVERLAKTFWDSDASLAVSAITSGDPAFFVAFKIRLDQIDCALVAHGRGIAERAPVIRAKYTVDGFLSTSVKVLEEMGGEWPPQPPTH